MELIKQLLSLNESKKKQWEVPFYIRCSEVSDDDRKKFEDAVKSHLEDDLRYDNLMNDEIDENITHELGGTIVVDADTEEEAMVSAQAVIDDALEATTINSDEYGVRIDGAYEKE